MNGPAHLIAQEAAQKPESEFGPIDIWINHAMVTVVSEFKDMTPEGFQRVTDGCYSGFVIGTLSALKRMQPFFSFVRNKKAKKRVTFFENKTQECFQTLTCLCIILPS